MTKNNNYLFDLRRLPPYFWLSLFFLLLLIAFNFRTNLPIKSFWTSFAFFDFIVVFYLFFVIVLIKNFFFQIRTKRTILIDKKNFISIFFSGYTLDFLIRLIPYIIFLYIYYAIHVVASQIIKYGPFDFWLIKIDQFILGGFDTFSIFEKIVSPITTSFFAFFYYIYTWFFIIPPIVFFFRGKKIFDVASMSLMITAYLGLVGYFLVPCSGPVLSQKNLFSCQLVMISGINYSQESIIAKYIINNNAYHCFPSLHFANTMVWLYFSWKYLRKERWFKYFYRLQVAVTLLIWLSTLYLRWHYVTDLIGGLLVALVGIYLGPKIIEYWEKKLKKPAQIQPYN